MRSVERVDRVAPVLAMDRRESLDLRRPMKWIGNALRSLVPAASSAFRIDGMVRLAISSPAEALALPDRCPQGITAHCLDQSYEAEREVAMTAFAKCWRRE